MIYGSTFYLKEGFFSLFVTSNINSSPIMLLLKTESTGKRNGWSK
jgi:hypothetical protein